MQAVYTQALAVPSTVYQYVTSGLKKIPNPVTVIKETEWRGLAKQTALKIKELSKELFKLLGYGILIKVSPYIFALGLTVGLAYPSETNAAVSRLSSGIYNTTLTEKIVVGAAAFFGLPTVTAPVAILMAAADCGAKIASKGNIPLPPASPASAVGEV